MTETIARKWVGDLRREVCSEDGLRTSHVVRVQGNFQHAAYFRRYREFIQQCVGAYGAQPRHASMWSALSTSLRIQKVNNGLASDIKNKFQEGSKSEHCSVPGNPQPRPLPGAASSDT